MPNNAHSCLKGGCWWRRPLPCAYSILNLDKTTFFLPPSPTQVAVKLSVDWWTARTFGSCSEENAYRLTRGIKSRCEEEFRVREPVTALWAVLGGVKAGALRGEVMEGCSAALC
jgi:hypothetical protein